MKKLIASGLVMFSICTLSGCESGDAGDAGEPKYVMCAVYTSSSKDKVSLTCQQGTSDHESYEICGDYHGEAMAIGSYKTDTVCKSDKQEVVDTFSRTGELERGSHAQGEAGAEGSSSGGSSSGNVGCSTTESALKSKCVKPKSGVVDNCVYECEAVCVEKDGCNCGIQEYCDGVRAACAAFKGTGCKCSWCS